MRWLSRLVARRPYRLFTPDPDTIYLTIEESRTFQKIKMLPDDCGLLRVVPGMLLLEAGLTRARLMAPDLELACDHCNSETSLRISARLGEYEWAITVRNPGKAGVLASFGSSRKCAEDLWRKIYERLMPPPPAAWGGSGGSWGT